jgi:hypothetical protein
MFVESIASCRETIEGAEARRHSALQQGSSGACRLCKHERMLLQMLEAKM